SARATRFRIQKPNSSKRSFAFVVHPGVIGLFADCVRSEFVEFPTQAVLFTSEGGFDDVDLLFTIAPPDFLTFICPDMSSDEKHFESILARVGRWMRHRFITTVIVSQERNVARTPASAQLMGDLRRISSQLVWANDGQDLKEILAALRFF
ncbi:hypothetical protein OA249_02960, partial [Litorivicinus sp.]|nr:hypothetical protein [Litorivicinus sp.]